MSVQNNITGGESVVLERPAAGGVYASLFEKINLSPVSELSALDSPSYPIKLPLEMKEPKVCPK